eukprot:jgi/Hompol1/4195/HPOL_001751-RA
MKGYFQSAAIYFASFIVIGALVFMKIIVAVVVSNLEEAYMLMEIHKRARYRRLKSIRAIAQSTESSTRETINMPKNDDPVWRSQIPYELPNFDNASKEKLEKYLIVLAVIEDNLAEYMRIKEELKKIQIELKQCNQSLLSQEEELDEAEEADEKIHCGRSTVDFSQPFTPRIFEIQNKGFDMTFYCTADTSGRLVLEL